MALSVVGELGALATALSWAVYSVLIRPLMRRYSALQLSAFVMVVGTLILVPFSVPSVRHAGLVGGAARCLGGPGLRRHPERHA